MSTKHLSSGGIGLTKAEWEQHHTYVEDIGDCKQYDADKARYYDYSQGYIVCFRRDPADSEDSWRVVEIRVDARFVFSKTLQQGPAESLTNDQINQAIRTMLPADAQLQRVDPSRWHSFPGIEYYYSKSMEDLFADLHSGESPWGGDPPGTIEVVSGQFPTALALMVGRFGAQSANPTPQPTFTLPSPIGPPEDWVSPQPVPTFPFPVPTR